MEKLVNAFLAALAARQADGIEGWGLNNPDLEVFNLVEVGSPVGCTSETCNHFSHDPAAPVNKLVPLDGWRVSILGDAEYAEDGYVTYYVTRRDAEARVWCLREENQFWAELREVQASDLPAWAMLNWVEVPA